MAHLTTKVIYQKSIWVVHKITRKDGRLGLKDSQETQKVGNVPAKTMVQN